MNEPLFYWDETDYYHKAGPRKLSLWRKFTGYVLPWIVLLGICFGLFLSMNYILQAMVLLSEPLSKYL